MFFCSHKITKFFLTAGVVMLSGAVLPVNAADTTIKVATKKYNNAAFAPITTNMNNLVTTLDGIVDTTLTQAGTISSLSSSKQTRPADAACPAYRQCMLVHGTDGSPHWYPIADPVYDVFKPIIAQNISATSGNITSDAGYTQLSYIESNGTPYINTGISGLNSGEWELYVKWLTNNVTQSSYAYVIGAYQGEAYNSYRIIVNQTNNNSYYLSGNSKAGGGSKLINSIAANTVHNGLIRNGSVSVDGVTYDTKTQGTTIPAANTIGLFRHGNGGAVLKGRIYESYAIKNGVYQYRMIPAKRNSDGAIGMYDTVRNGFYGNSASSGAFTSGSVVANTDIPVATWSVELTGTEGSNVTAGTVYGTSVCNAVSASANAVATSANLSSANWTTAGNYCWCSITSVKTADGYGTRDNRWVLKQSSSSCSSDCAAACASGVGGGANGAFRTAISNVN